MGFFEPVPALKPKDACGIPWRVAFALQADGWTLRSDIIWAKPNPMPESVTDRPTKSHEYLFLLAKSSRYFYDADAVRQPHAPHTLEAIGGHNGKSGQQDTLGKVASGNWGDWGKPRVIDPRGANLRSVWTIPTESYIGAHFATFPRRLVEPCIRAGTSGRGVCPACSAPWVREVERTPMVVDERNARRSVKREMGLRTAVNGTMIVPPSSITLGWRPSCPCDAGEPVPATVLDPFIGSGTTIVVAEALGRRGVGLDLSMDYLGLARRRIERPHARIPRPQSAGPSLPLFPDR